MAHAVPTTIKMAMNKNNNMMVKLSGYTAQIMATSAICMCAAAITLCLFT